MFERSGPRRRSAWLAGRLAAGVLAGALAWTGGYAASYALIAPEVAASPLHRVIEMLGGRPPTTHTVGWLFFNAHFVDLVIRSLPRIGRLSVTFVSGSTLFTLGLYAIPIVALTVGGAALARYRGRGLDPGDGSDEDSPGAVRRGVFAGATVLAGYLPASMAAAAIFEFTTGQAVAAPHVPTAVLLAGIAYPLAFGGIGGGAAVVLGITDRSR